MPLGPCWIGVAIGRSNDDGEDRVDEHDVVRVEGVDDGNEGELDCNVGCTAGSGGGGVNPNDEWWIVEGMGTAELEDLT